MNIDLNPKGIIEKLAIAAIFGLLAHGYHLYTEVCELIELKPQIVAIQQYILDQEDSS